MTAPRNEMELKEEAIRAHYTAATEMLMRVDHAPRIAAAKRTVTGPEKSPDLAAMQRRFRSTTPGLITRSMARSEGVRLVDRVAATDDDDPLTSPVQAAVAHPLRRALAIALAVGEAFAGQTGLLELKKANLENRLAAARATEFTELLAAEALVVLSVFANATAFLLSADATEVSVEIGPVEEVLTDNAQLALRGALWEFDQDIAVFATEESKLAATVLGYAEQLMEKVKLRAGAAPRLEADARFAGRAIKNITDAVKVRAMEFERPDEWMEKPELFLFRPYDEKTAMIAELRRPVTVEMVVQEINRYADSEFRYADKSDEVAIEGAVRDMRRMEEAKRRYLEGKG